MYACMSSTGSSCHLLPVVASLTAMRTEDAVLVCLVCWL